MTKLYIGMKFHGHDSSVFYIDMLNKDIFAIATERMTRFKHDDLFAISAIQKLVEYKKINAHDVNELEICIPFTTHKYEKYPGNFYTYNIKLRELLKSKYIKGFFIAFYNFKKQSLLIKVKRLLFSVSGLVFLVQYMLSKKNIVSLDRITRKHLKSIFPNSKVNIKYYDHEFCHAASAFYMSPYDDALVFSMDGFGDNKVFSRVYIGKGDELDEVGFSVSESEFLNLGNSELSKLATLCSIGGVYSYITKLLGFQEGADEGKTEALAAYGSYDNYFYKGLLEIASVVNGQVVMDVRKAEEILNYSKMLEILSALKKEDIAASVQRFSEDIILEYVKFYVIKYRIKNICLSGGVHANVIINLNIFENVTKNIFIIPAMADDGAAQGALLANLIEHKHDISWVNKKQSPYYGTSYSTEQVVSELKKHKDKINFKYLGRSWPNDVAQRVVNGKIGAIFHGRMEFGPRALGNRSIIASPTISSIRSRMNLEIKRRPEFQPFCPSILDEEKNRLFDDAYLNKHMTTAFRLKEEYYDDLPSAIHIDGTARVQFVTEAENPNYYKLLKEVKKLTGFGVVLNTSFNKHGRTIVESPNDAIIDFMDTDMDYLVIEGYLVTRI